MRKLRSAFSRIEVLAFIDHGELAGGECDARAIETRDMIALG
jgi:hypothetical protein